MHASKSICIAHISDLHFTSQMRWFPEGPEGMARNQSWAARLLDLQLDLLNESQSPDILVVTGDIIDNAAWEIIEGSLPQALMNARNFLESLCTKLFKSTQDNWKDRLFVIPGNHDTKILGNIRREELLNITNTKRFQFARWLLGKAVKAFLRKHNSQNLFASLEPVFDRKMREALQTVPASLQHFLDVFAPYMESRYTPDRKCFLFCVDSNDPRDSFLNFAQGAITPDEDHKLREKAKERKLARLRPPHPPIREERPTVL